MLTDRENETERETMWTFKIVSNFKHCYYMLCMYDEPIRKPYVICIIPLHKALLKVTFP